MKQIERIHHYESLLERVEQANGIMERALEAFEKVEPLCEELSEYLNSKEWKKDFEDDEAGRLPPFLKRGVLAWTTTASLWPTCSTWLPAPSKAEEPRQLPPQGQAPLVPT